MAKLINLTQRGVAPLFEQGEDDDDGFPIIYYTTDVYLAINHIVNTQNKEVAWMGLVEQLSDTEYLIYKLYIPEQIVSQTTVDISNQAIAQLANKIIDEGEDTSKLRYHGHSHVNMKVMPSHTDQEHMLDYLEHSEWFIREIRNKKGEQKVDLFDKRCNLSFQNLESEVWEFTRDAAFYENLDQQMEDSIKEQKPIVSASKFNQNLYLAKNRLSQLPDKTPDELELEEILSDPFGCADPWTLRNNYGKY